ncbi:MAG: DNA repair protein RecN [Verrucomicrobia bacterium]|nr:DNA repair protein RecN [Verrucomicrobiota bacterium]
MSAMLRSLRIRNLALVEELEWDLPAGFTAVTGETGAGKSIILGALKFLLGERADRGVVRSGADSAGIEAVFSFDGEAATAEIDVLLEESGVDRCQDGELILKRTIAAEGSASVGRQFINGSPCNLSVLKELGTHLVDLHGPHDHQSLFSRREQTLLLDRFSESLLLREEYSACRRAVLASRRELDELEQTSGGDGRVAQLQLEVDEIGSANLTEGEEESLNSRYKAASNGRRLIEISSTALARLDDEEIGATKAIAEAARMLRELGRLDDRAAPYLEGLERITGDIDSLNTDLRDYAETIEVDAGELQQLEDRVNLLATLRRKYGQSLSDVILRGEESAKQLERLSGLAELKATSGKRLTEASKKLLGAATTLGAKRQEGAAKLAKTVAGALADLGFRQAGFEITLEPQTEPGSDGAEIAEFLFAPNPGEPISRVMLALKTALADQDKIPLLVFDEIDANVGGEIASKVAGKMKELGRGHQVLCITHLPQVAAAASTQFMVMKSVQDGRTGTTLAPVIGTDRVEEIARMLGGVTDSAKAHARSLLEEADIVPDVRAGKSSQEKKRKA